MTAAARWRRCTGDLPCSCLPASLLTTADIRTSSAKLSRCLHARWEPQKPILTCGGYRYPPVAGSVPWREGKYPRAVLAYFAASS